MANEREAVPFEEQLRGMEAVVKAGKVRTSPRWLETTVTSIRRASACGIVSTCFLGLIDVNSII